ncbi:MAG: hypothetical protein NVSMB31_03020 [Vulcanimicrobiaceae bacterium]
MKHIAALIVMITSLLGVQPVLAQSVTAPGPASGSLVYDDASMHFSAPAGYIRLTPNPSEATDKLAPIVGFLHNPGKDDQIMITLEVQQYQGTPQDWASAAEQQLRGRMDNPFIKKDALRLSNGMPAYFMKVAFGEGFGSMQQYAYAIFDGRRGILVGATAKLGVLDNDKAKELLKDLSVVLYPRGR